MEVPVRISDKTFLVLLSPCRRNSRTGDWDGRWKLPLHSFRVGLPLPSTRLTWRITNKLQLSDLYFKAVQLRCWDRILTRHQMYRGLSWFCAVHTGTVPQTGHDLFQQTVSNCSFTNHPIVLADSAAAAHARSEVYTEFT